jgi:hypothetical protein
MGMYRGHYRRASIRGFTDGQEVQNKKKSNSQGQKYASKAMHGTRKSGRERVRERQRQEEY